MIDHIGFRVRDLQAARRFYEAVASAVGFQVTDNTGSSFLIGRSKEEPLPFVWVGTDEPAFWTADNRTSASPIHLAFAAPDAAAVDAFHRAGLAAGGRDNGAPGPRGPAEMGFYGAFLLDPDGNNVEAGWRDPNARSNPRIERCGFPPAAPSSALGAALFAQSAAPDLFPEARMSGAWRLAAALAALSSLALSLTQLADLPARQAMESFAWLVATGHGRHYVGTHSLATLVDIGAILALTVNASRERALPRLIWTAAAGLFAASLIAWTLLVLPMIEIIARWTGGSAPSDFALVRDQWETGHGAMAGLKLAGFVALVFGHVRARRTRAMPAGSSPHLRAGLPRGRLCR